MVPTPTLGEERSDEEVVARIRAGDERALEALHVKYWHALVRAAVRYVSDEELARDVVQDVFSDVWYRRAEWVLRGSITSYLYGAVRNRAISVARHERRTTRWSDSAAQGERSGDEYAAEDVSQVEQLEVTELDALLRVRLRSLPERCRETYVLYRGGDLTVAEVARIMGVSTETAKTQIKRAMAALRDTVNRYRER